MDKRKALINVSISVGFKVIILILTLLSRRFLINKIGDDANGMYALFNGIIGFFAVAELGFGTAIVFSMYKPIVNNDIDVVSGLYHFYKKIYRFIALIILVIGLIVTPLLGFITKDYEANSTLYISFLIYLFAILITYLYSDKVSFINAYTDNHITTIIISLGLILELLLQIIVLLTVKSLILFFATILISNIIQYTVINIVFSKRYSDKINEVKVIDDELKKEVYTNTKAMFSHKIGGVLVTTTDSIIISAFVSLTALGLYTNYISIAVSLTSLLAIVFTSVGAILGHSFATNSKKVFYKNFKFMYYLNFILGFVSMLGFYAIIRPLLKLVLQTDNFLDNKIVFVISLNYFIQFMRRATLSFRDASGIFYYDRFKPIFEGVINLILSIILVIYFDIIGVLIATVITSLLINHIVEPFVLYKYGFEEKPKRFYILNYFSVILFAIAMLVFNFVKISHSNTIVLILVNGFISVGISLVVLILAFIFVKDFREQTKIGFSQIKMFIRKIKDKKKE